MTFSAGLVWDWDDVGVVDEDGQDKTEIQRSLPGHSASCQSILVLFLLFCLLCSTIISRVKFLKLCRENLLRRLTLLLMVVWQNRIVSFITPTTAYYRLMLMFRIRPWLESNYSIGIERVITTPSEGERYKFDS